MIKNITKYHILTLLLLVSSAYASEQQPIGQQSPATPPTMEGAPKSGAATNGNDGQSKQEPNVNALKAQINDLQKQLDTLNGRSVVRLDNWIKAHAGWPTITRWRIVGLLTAAAVAGAVICIANQEDDTIDEDGYYGSTRCCSFKQY